MANRLTESELKVLKYIYLTTKEIAKILFLSETTVATHLISIYQKLYSKNKAQAMLIALKKKIYTLKDFDMEGTYKLLNSTKKVT